MKRKLLLLTLLCSTQWAFAGPIEGSTIFSGGIAASTVFNLMASPISIVPSGSLSTSLPFNLPASVFSIEASFFAPLISSKPGL